MASTSTSFRAVYTQDKHKKQNKRWLEGYVKFNPDTNKLTLYDESEKVIKSHNLKPHDEVKDGEELDVGIYQVVVNEVISEADNCSEVNADIKKESKTVLQNKLGMPRRSLSKKRKYPQLLHVLPTRTSNLKKTETQDTQESNGNVGSNCNNGGDEDDALKLNTSPSNDFEYTALYTTQKVKKIKSWIEGYANYNKEKHCLIIYDSEKKVITRHRLKADQSVNEDETIDCGIYLVQLESIKKEPEIPKNTMTGKRKLSKISALKRVCSGLEKPKMSKLKSKEDIGNSATNAGSDTIRAKENTKHKPDTFKSPVNPIPKDLHFTSKGELECLVQFYSNGRAREPMRTLVAPLSFPSWKSYQATYISLLREHLQIQMIQVAMKYHRLISETEKESNGSTFQTLPKYFPKTQDKGVIMERRSKALGLGYYSSCALKPSWSSNSVSLKASSYINSLEGPMLQEKIGSVFIEVNHREHYSKYAKDDIWAISLSKKFSLNETFLGRSLYFGPSKENLIELQLFGERDEKVANTILSVNQDSKGLERKLRGNSQEKHDISALRCLSSASDLTMIDVLETVEEPESVPILPSLVNPALISSRTRKSIDEYIDHFEAHYKSNPHPLGLNPNEVFEKAKSIITEYIERYRLNIEQASILDSAVMSVTGRYMDVFNSIKIAPFTLIHGPFGTGKSFLVSVLVMCLEDLADNLPEVFGRNDDEMTCDKAEGDMDEANSPQVDYRLPRLRVLITSMTNVAVDNVLLSLLTLGYTGFMRVGSLKRIAKPILAHTARSGQSETDDIKVLEEMLESTKDENDRECIERTLQQMRGGTETTSNTLEDAFVVGCTCLASSLAAIRGQSFPLVIVDEACQVPEPMVMVPLLRFQCQMTILIGDPLQLPPTMTTMSAKKAEGKGLDRTLFSRLKELGFSPHFLKTQYRCHPHIAEICNQQFYSGSLVHGVSDESRAPIISIIPPMLFLDVLGKEEKQHKSMSSFNKAEADTAVKLVRSLINAGVAQSQIGIIALYKRQAEILNDRINTGTSAKHSIQVSTVDAFQGSEKDIIILSCVKTTSLGFVTNSQRINVALSRARHHCIILGYSKLLETNPMWKSIINHSKNHKDGFQPCQAFLQKLLLSDGVEYNDDDFPEKSFIMDGTIPKIASEAACTDTDQHIEQIIQKGVADEYVEDPRESSPEQTEPVSNKEMIQWLAKIRSKKATTSHSTSENSESEYKSYNDTTHDVYQTSVTPMDDENNLSQAIGIDSSDNEDESPDIECLEVDIDII